MSRGVLGVGGVDGQLGEASSGWRSGRGVWWAPREAAGWDVARGAGRGAGERLAVGWDALQSSCGAMGVGERWMGGGRGLAAPVSRAMGSGAKIARGTASYRRLVIGGARRGGMGVLRQFTFWELGKAQTPFPAACRWLFGLSLCMCFLACCALAGCCPRWKLAGVGDSWFFGHVSVFLCCDLLLELLPYPQKATRSNRSYGWAVGRGPWRGPWRGA